MATEKKIAANRANAKRSTELRSLAGKLASSRNAHRHGLSVRLPLDAELLEKVDIIATALVEATLMTKKLEPMHPGEVLREEFLVPLGMSPARWREPAASRVRGSSGLRARRPA